MLVPFILKFENLIHLNPLSFNFLYFLLILYYKKGQIVKSIFCIRLSV